MSTRGIRSDIRTALQDGKVDEREVDQLVLKARDGGRIDTAERRALHQLLQQDRFEVARDRLRAHLGFVDSKPYVNTEIAGARLESIEGRVAHLSTSVRGLRADVGLFDNAVALAGTAAADGRLSLLFDGRPVAVDIKRGDTAAVAMEKVRATLPGNVRAHVFANGLYPWDAAKLEGRSAAATDTDAHMIVWRPLPLELPPGTRPLRVLVTGYGPFGGYPTNPSGELAKAVGALGVRGAQVVVEVLPVEYGQVEAFVERIRRDPPDIVLSMGVGPREVEVKAYNWNAGHTDVAGQPGPGRGEIRAGGEGVLDTNLPIASINERLAGTFGSAATLASTADPPPPGEGAYLCNYLNYRLLETFRSTRTAAGFVHISPQTSPAEIQTVLEAVVAEKVRRDTPIS